jgi:hypothetical protein
MTQVNEDRYQPKAAAYRARASGPPLPVLVPVADVGTSAKHDLGSEWHLGPNGKGRCEAVVHWDGKRVAFTFYERAMKVWR